MLVRRQQKLLFRLPEITLEYCPNLGISAFEAFCGACIYRTFSGNCCFWSFYEHTSWVPNFRDNRPVYVIIEQIGRRPVGNISAFKTVGGGLRHAIAIWLPDLRMSIAPLSLSPFELVQG